MENLPAELVVAVRPDVVSTTRAFANGYRKKSLSSGSLTRPPIANVPGGVAVRVFLAKWPEYWQATSEAPKPVAVTRPTGLTVAVLGWLDSHLQPLVTSLVVPSRSVATTVSCEVSPMLVNARLPLSLRNEIASCGIGGTGAGGGTGVAGGAGGGDGGGAGVETGPGVGLRDGAVGGSPHPLMHAMIATNCKTLVSDVLVSRAGWGFMP